MNETSDWIDFNQVKESADAPLILHKLGIMDRLDGTGDNRTGFCPIGKEHGKKDSFSFNMEKKVFQCFACKRRGSILDLVKIVLNLPTVRDGALWIKELDIEPATNAPEAENASREDDSASSIEDVVNNLNDENGSYTISVMTFREACFQIKQHGLDPQHLCVVDVRKLADLVQEIASSG